MAITQEKLDELEVLHKRIAHVKGRPNAKGEPEWEVVYRKPKRAEYKMFRRNASNEQAKSEAQEILARQLVVYPELSAFDALLEDYPGIPEASSKAFVCLNGMESDESVK